jgi:hypothetical protein
MDGGGGYHNIVHIELQPYMVAGHGVTLQDILHSVLCTYLVHRNIFSNCYSNTQNNPDILVGLVALVVVIKKLTLQIPKTEDVVLLGYDAVSIGNRI